VTDLENQIAGLRETETALRITELWQKKIFNYLQETVFVVTPDRKLVDVNDGAVKMFGYSREELASLSTAVLHVDQDHYVEFGKIIQEAFNRSEPANFEFEAKRRDGEIFPTEHTVTFLKGDQGDHIGIVSVVRDMTERNQYERELERRAEERTAELRGAARLNGKHPRVLCFPAHVHPVPLPQPVLDCEARSILELDDQVLPILPLNVVAG
jgi:PAS domain S-box-containing protein